MTREEQIIEAGTYHLCELRPTKTCGHNMHELAYISRNLAFEAGAKWADANPQFSKEKFIEKACWWLRETAHFYVSDFTGDLDDNGLLEDFKKAMEE